MKFPFVRRGLRKELLSCVDIRLLIVDLGDKIEVNIMRHKKFYFDKSKKRYVRIYLFKTVKEMQDFHKKLQPGIHSNRYKNLGVSIHRVYEKQKGKSMVYVPKTGDVLLNLNYCGAGVVSHELMHATLWAWKHKPTKKQYPIVIRSMKEEEEILHDFTYLTRHFYDWYWKVHKTI